MDIWGVLGAVGAFGLTSAVFLRLADERTERRAWVRLLDLAAPDGQRFHPDQIADLPEAVRRYFGYVIRPGARIAPVAEIEMGGQIGLGRKAAPGYVPMRARQILAPRHGFVWVVTTRRLRGSDGMVDGHSWTRFALFGALPVVRVAGPDHLRSSLGRALAEGLFWAPGGLLPGPGLHWSAPAADTARITLRVGGLEQSADVHLAADGRPLSVVVPRWSNANPEKRWQIQPFGGTLDGFEEFAGHLLPTRVEGGNHFGTPDYFPFYRAQVRAIRFPDRD